MLAPASRMIGWMVAAAAIVGCGDDELPGDGDAAADAGPDASMVDGDVRRDGGAPGACAADVVVLVSTTQLNSSWQDRLGVALGALPGALAGAGVSAHIGVLRDLSESVGWTDTCSAAGLGAGDGALQPAGNAEPSDPDFPAGCTGPAPAAGRGYFVIPDELAEAQAGMPCTVRQQVSLEDRLNCEREPLEVLATSMRCGSACPGNAGFHRPDALLAVLHVTVGDDCSTRVPGAFEGSNEVTLPGSGEPVRNHCVAAHERGDLVPVADLLAEWRALRPGPVLYTLVADSFEPHTAVVDGSGMTSLAHGCFRDRGLLLCDSEAGFVAGAVPRLGELVSLLGDEGVHVSMCTLPGYSDCALGPPPDPRLEEVVNDFGASIIARLRAACE